MNIETMIEQTSDTDRMLAFQNALRAISESLTKASPGESWFDEPSAESDPVYELQIDDSWMEDLDEAA